MSHLPATDEDERREALEAQALSREWHGFQGFGEPRTKAKPSRGAERCRELLDELVIRPLDAEGFDVAVKGGEVVLTLSVQESWSTAGPRLRKQLREAEAALAKASEAFYGKS